MHAVDTNVLVRLIVRDNGHQTAAAEAFIESGVWVSTLAFAEAIWVLDTVYKLTPRDLARTIAMLLDNPKLILQESDAVAAALEIFRARPALRFSDCLILQLARRAGHLPLGTFDRALAKSEGAAAL